MRLHPLTEPEYQFWKARSHAAYALDKMRANGFTREEADKIAAESFQRLLPQGLQTPHHYLFSAKDGDTLLGFVWFQASGAENNRRAFVLDVIVEEAHRGKGHGKALMRLAEEEASKLGLRRIGLHVFGHNEPAIRLYRSLGYDVTDLVMEKGL